VRGLAFSLPLPGTHNHGIGQPIGHAAPIEGQAFGRQSDIRSQMRRQVGRVGWAMPPGNERREQHGDEARAGLPGNIVADLGPAGSELQDDHS
jgi:hypothetical protein